MTTPNDKFKLIETAPEFAYSPTGSYTALSFKSAYVLKFKNPESGSTVITSGIVGSNSIISVPTPTILEYNSSVGNGTDFDWSGVNWKRDNKLPNFSYSANAVELTRAGNNLIPNPSNLISVAIGTKVTSIGDRVFFNCGGLTSITIPDNVTSIGDGAFSRCIGLKSIIISNLVTIISESTFENCRALTSIIIPNLVMTINRRAFWNCTSLISVIIPDSITGIEYTAFENCNQLQSVYINTINGLNIQSPSNGPVEFYGAFNVNILPPTQQS